MRSVRVTPAATALVLLSLLSGAAVRADPPTDYILHCRGCHGPAGRGITGVIPPLGEAGRFLAVPGGREYLIRVPGVSTSELDDARTAALLNWIVGRFGEAPAGAPPFTAAEVAAHRRPPLTDVKKARRTLLASEASWKDAP